MSPHSNRPSPKTVRTVKLSLCESYTSLSLTSDAWRAICAATSLWGRPAAEKMGIFCPRATEFITSMAEMPGFCLCVGRDGVRLSWGCVVRLVGVAQTHKQARMHARVGPAWHAPVWIMERG